MEISATVTNSASAHSATVRTGAVSQSLAVPAKATGLGSAVNGGEFLMLALATCYCNDLYREAGRLRIPIEGVEVQATAEFPGVGLAATQIRYRAVVKSSASAEAIAQLLCETDAVAEVHNTVRAGVPVELHRQ
jgi:organic hydroperoxide reductase OsmC/OhrA